jgi:hypothetical protein
LLHRMSLLEAAVRDRRAASVSFNYHQNTRCQNTFRWSV